MSLGDVLTHRVLDGQQVQAAVASLFGIPTDVVLVVSDLEQLLGNTAPHRRVLCHFSHIPSGDFRTLLSFHEGEFSSLPRLETARRLCSILQCDCLISGNTINPYSMVLVTSQGEAGAVALDAERLDSSNEYVILPARLSQE